MPPCHSERSEESRPSAPGALSSHASHVCAAGRYFLRLAMPVRALCALPATARCALVSPAALLGALPVLLRKTVPFFRPRRQSQFCPRMTGECTLLTLSINTIVKSAPAAYNLISKQCRKTHPHKPALAYLPPPKLFLTGMAIGELPCPGPQAAACSVRMHR